MKRYRPYFIGFSCIAGVLAAASPLLAQTTQSTALEHHYQTWLSVQAQGPVASHVRFFGDVQLRLFDDGHPQVFMLRPGLLFALTRETWGGIGYAWAPQWSAPGESMTDEHRLWQQWVWALPPQGGRAWDVQLRTRFEERYQHQHGNNDIGFRLRHFVRFAHTLGAQSPWSAVVWDEVFLGLNKTDWGQPAGFDQNRVFVGTAFAFGPPGQRIEAGYINQYLARTAHDTMNHGALATTYFVF